MQKQFSNRLRKALAKEYVKNDSTFNQRRALFNMYTELGWDVRRIRDMSFDEAQEALQKASDHIERYGFPERSKSLAI